MDDENSDDDFVEDADEDADEDANEDADEDATEDADEDEVSTVKPKVGRGKKGRKAPAERAANEDEVDHDNDHNNDQEDNDNGHENDGDVDNGYCQLQRIS